MTDYMKGQAQDVDVGIRGLSSLNNGVRTMPVNGDVTINPGHVDTARDVVVSPQTDPVAYDDTEGSYIVSGQQVSFETVKLARYLPGGIQIAGLLVTIPAAPSSGTLDAGLSRVPFDAFDGTSGTFNQDDSGVFLRLDSDGDYSFVIRRSGVETVIPRDGPGGNWSGDEANRSWSGEQKSGMIDNDNDNVTGAYYPFDAFDGSGPDERNPSGVDIDPPVSLLVKLFGTYYGKGPYYLGFDVVGAGGYQRPYPAVGFETTGDQTIITRPQQPVMARYDDGGAGNTYSFGVGGRQASHTGEFAEDPITPFHFYNDFSISAGTTEADADLLLAYRRKPDSVEAAATNFKGTEFGLLEVDTYNDQRVFFFLSLDPDFGGQTPAWEDPSSVGEDDPPSPIQVANQDDTAADLTADGTTGRHFGGEIVGSGKNSATVSDAEPADQPTPRTKPIGLFALSLTGQSTTDSELVAKWDVRA